MNSLTTARQTKSNVDVRKEKSSQLQGFLNAIVYGWTRDDFVHKVVGTATQSRSTET